MVMFHDRKDAGERLARLLSTRRFERPVVLGIPRGGVPVAAEVARALGAELGVIVARKLGAPGQHELAIGAVAADGTSFVDAGLAREVGASSKYIAEEQAREAAEAKRREDAFDGSRRPPIRGREVIVVDDGLATGATAIAALRSVKALGAARVILAVPVGAQQSIGRLVNEADEVVCAQVEPHLYAIGHFYVDFRAVLDSEVKAILDYFEPLRTNRNVEHVTIVRDGIRLAAVLSVPEGPPPFPCVLFVHGLGSDKDSPRNVVISTQLLDAGFATVRFDLNGHGESPADPADGEAFPDDLAAVWEWTLRRPEVNQARVGVAGSSLGGVVILDALRGRQITPATIILRSPPIEIGDLDQVDIPCLVMVGGNDLLRRGIKLAVGRCPAASLFVVNGAGHLYEEPGTLNEVVRHTVEWCEAALGPARG